MYNVERRIVDMSEIDTQEHSFLAHQGVGDLFSGTYYVESVFIRKTRGGKDFSDMTLRDRSGSRFVKYWGVVDGFQKGDFVFISAGVEDYMGNSSIVAKNVEKSDPPSDLSNYIPVYEKNDENEKTFGVVRSKLKELEAACGDDIASRIVDGIFGNNIFLKKLLIATGSNRSHYGRVGGLLANTVRVAKQCMNAVDAYGLTDMEKIVLMASSLLFRIGAIDAYEFQDCVPVATTRGTLLGIENLTMTRISSALKRVVAELAETQKVPNQEMIMQIFHAVSACSCSSVLPMTKEAILLASMYRMDSEMVEAIDFIENDPNVSESFTAYDSALRRKYYTGCKKLE